MANGHAINENRKCEHSIRLFYVTVKLFEHIDLASDMSDIKPDMISGCYSCMFIIFVCYIQCNMLLRPILSFVCKTTMLFIS